MTAKISGKDGALVGGALLTGVAFVLAWAFPVWPGDEVALRGIQGWQSPGLTAVFRTVSYLGWVPVAISAAALTGGLLFLNRQRADALLLVLAVMPTALIPALKSLIGRPRPDYAIIDSVPSSLGFPSGHATFAMLLGGILIYLVGSGVRNPLARRGLVGGLVLLIALVGVSRVYLGVHWPSDVIGGYLYGVAALAGLIRLRERLAELRRSP